MARIFSGIKPSGEMHLGNYLGAVRRWVDQQADGECIYCVVDLHAMTVPHDPDALRAGTRRLAALLVAAGIDPDRSILFVQSHVPVVTELTWILNCVATFGELRRMTQFKEKGRGQGSVSAGLFDYPVLMAADILAYDTDEVPVGEDQIQHVELTRDLALRFNHRFGETLVVPRATVPPVAARVKDLQHPARKMSKSEESPQGTILVLDPPEVIRKKVRSAVTDSGTEVRHDPEHKPGVSNLLELYAVATGTTLGQAEAAFDGRGYGDLKAAVGDALCEMLAPLQRRYAELDADPRALEETLAQGAAKADAVATATMQRVRDAVGLLPRRR